MATSNNTTPASRFHNLNNEALADAIGHADAIVKGAEAELTALKDGAGLSMSLATHSP